MQSIFQRCFNCLYLHKNFEEIENRIKYSRRTGPQFQKDLNY